MASPLRRWIPALGLVAMLYAAIVASGGNSLGLPSARSRSPNGLRVAARYLWERGHPVGFLETNSPQEEPLPDGTVLLTAFPTARRWTPEDVAVMVHWVRSGGRLVVLASARSELPEPLASALGVASVHRKKGDPGDWETWEAHHQNATTFSGEAGTLRGELDEWWVDCPTPSVPAMGGGDQEGPPRVRASYLDGEERAHVCTLTLGEGEVVVVDDASVLWNERLAIADNLSFLESLVPDGATVDGVTVDGATVEKVPVYFDEYHQGLAVAAPGELGLHLDVLVFQAGILYLLVAWQRSRPLGPPRPRLVDREPGMAGELRTLGKLHAAGGHGAEAARHLLGMARQRLGADERLGSLPEQVGSGGRALAEALAVGQRLAEIERGSA